MPDDEQLQLITGHDGIDLVATPGRSTGERLKEQRPDLYALVVQGVAEGMGLRALARVTGLHPRTVAAVRDGSDHAGAIATAKQRAARNLAVAVEVWSERLADEAESIPIGQSSVPLAIAIDKLQLLEGAPTAIIDHRTGPSHQEMDAWLANLRRVEPVEGNGNGLQKGAGPRAIGQGDIDGASIVSRGSDL
jgi:hypothetical protein